MSRATPTLTLAYKEVGGHKVHLDCHLPAAEHVRDGGKPVPVVVWIHGGGALPLFAPNSSRTSLASPTWRRTGVC